jgi:hypothetical protein
MTFQYGVNALMHILVDGVSPTHSIAAVDIMEHQHLHRDMPHNHSVNIPHKSLNQSTVQATNNNTLMRHYPPNGGQVQSQYYDQQQPLIGGGPERQNDQLYGRAISSLTKHTFLMQKQRINSAKKIAQLSCFIWKKSTVVYRLTATSKSVKWFERLVTWAPTSSYLCK